MAKAILVNPKDNVAVMIEPAVKGDRILVENGGDSTVSMTAVTGVPVYHKFARSALKKGEPVIKYGEEIGVATSDIPQGAHVHVHNVTSRSLLQK